MPDGDQFCGGCGTRLDNRSTSAADSTLTVPQAKNAGTGLGRFARARSGLDIGDGGDDVLLDGTAVNQAVRSETEVHSSAQVRWVILGVVALGLLVVGLSQWPTGEAPPERDSDTAAEDDNTEDGDSSSSRSSTTSAPVDDGADDPGTTEATENGLEKDAEDETVGGDVAIGPVLGTEVGFGVVLGGTERQDLSLLDLDTGRVYELAARGHPVGVFDGAVVLRRNETVSLLSFDRQDAEGLALPRSPGGWTEVVAIGGDRLWVIEGDPTEDAEGFPVAGYNSAGERVDEATINPWFASGSLDPTGQLIQTSGGGVYIRNGDGFQRRSTGSLLVAGEEIVLLRECDDEMACQQVWYDRETWEPLDYPKISLPTQGRSTLQNGDRWLYTLSWMTGKASLHEVRTGRTVPTGEGFGSHGQLMQAPISSDGRFLVEAVSSGVRILDLQDGTEWVHELPDLPSYATTFGVFVDLADVGFLE